MSKDFFKNGDTQTKNGKVFKYYNGNWSEVKKRSGAKEVRGMTKERKEGIRTIKAKEYFGVIGWNASKQRGMISVSAFENEKSTRFTNKQGEESIMLLFEVIYKKTGQKHLEIAQYKFNTGKAFLQKLGMVISTKAPNGGYFGKMNRK